MLNPVCFEICGGGIHAGMLIPKKVTLTITPQQNAIRLTKAELNTNELHTYQKQVFGLGTQTQHQRGLTQL